MKLPVLSNLGSLCEQCVALCCRYYAFAIDPPKTKRDFEDIRWFMLHEDTLIFVEEGEWFIQVNRKCRALLPDNRCGIYENRPAICREYTTEACDFHGDEYDYDELFTEPEQIERYAREYLAKQRKRKAAARRRVSANGKARKPPARAATGAGRRAKHVRSTTRARGPATKPAKKKTVHRGRARKGTGALRLLKSA